MGSTLVAVAILVGADPNPRFDIQLRKSDDAVAVAGDQERTTFTIASPSGIGSASIERKSDTWPKAVVLRLRLKGLENLKLTNGTDVLGAAVASRDKDPDIRQWKGEKETALPGDDPMRMTIRLLDAAGKPAAGVPLKDGEFEVMVPAAFLKGNPKQITIAWIDFYR